MTPHGAPSPPGFVRLNRSGPTPAAQVGRIFLVAIPLALLGVGILAAFFINPAGKGDAWVMPLVGGAFAAVGLLLLYAGVRGLRGMGVPATEILLEGGPRLAAGDRRRLLLRQPGPVAIGSLTAKLVAERVYQRLVKPKSPAVED